MKKLYGIKLGLIIFAIVIVAIITILNVNAEEAINQISFKDDETGIEYTINGFELRIYAPIKNNEETDTPEEEIDAQEEQSFSDRIPLHTITLDPTTYTINPECKTDAIYKIPTRFVDLNLSVTKEEIEQLIKDKIPTLATEDEAYYGELVVNYTFTTLPQEYPYYYNFNYIEAFAGIFEPSYQLPQIALNNPVSQVLNYVFYVKQDGEDIVSYETELTEDNGVANYIMNWAIFSKKEVENNTNESTEPGDQYRFMFHSIDNIDFLIEATKEVPPTEDEEEPTKPEDVIDEMLNPTKPESTQKEQVVPVDNTSANISGFIYFISLIFIAIGSTILYK